MRSAEYPNLTGQKLIYANNGEALSVAGQVASLMVDHDVRVLFFDTLPDDLLQRMYSNDCDMAVVYQRPLTGAQGGTLLEINVVGKGVVVIRSPHVLDDEEESVYRRLEAYGIPVIKDEEPMFDSGLHGALNLLNSKLAGV